MKSTSQLTMKLLHMVFSRPWLYGAQIPKRFLLKSYTLFEIPFISQREAQKYFYTTTAENPLSDLEEQEAMGEPDYCCLCGLTTAGSPIAAVIINGFPW